MIAREILQAASVDQLKCWYFAVTERLRHQFKDGLGKFAQLWKMARDNVGQKSLVFGLDKWQIMQWRNENILGYAFAKACINSLENDPRLLVARSGRFQRYVAKLIDPEWMDAEFKHACTDLKDASTKYRPEVMKMILQFYKEDAKSQDILWIAADNMEEFDGLTFEPAHFRSGEHGLSCPVVLHILRMFHDSQG